MYTIQRATVLLTLVFLVYHLTQFRIPKLLGQLAAASFYPALSRELSTTVGGVPWAALFYVIGIGATVTHFANGLWGFCFSWGIFVSRRSQRIAATAFGVVGLACFLLGGSTAIYFATGLKLGLPADLGGGTSNDAQCLPGDPAPLPAQKVGK
jgi:succinate dehydrogenase/fumarate reductase cytochrome b subunit